MIYAILISIAIWLCFQAWWPLILGIIFWLMYDNIWILIAGMLWQMLKWERKAREEENDYRFNNYD